MSRPRLQRTLDGLHKCYICKELKHLQEFYRESKRADGYGFRCKSCNKIYKKIYHKNYFSLEETRRKKREYWRKNPEKMKEMNRRNREKNGHKWAEKNKLKHRENPIPNMLTIAKTRARKKGLKFFLEASDITIPQYCPALGVKLEVGMSRCNRYSPSLDRIDNTKGYVKGNVVVVSHRANTIKSDATIEELRKLIAFYESLK